MMKRIIFLCFFCWSLIQVYAQQGYIETGYTPSRDFLNEDKEKLGSGDNWQVSGRYSFPFSVKTNDKGQPIAWSGTVSGTYARMNNKDEAAFVNPDDVMNLSFNVSHLRPISKKWYMMASLGVGIYTETAHISYKGILANGAVIFAYKLKENLDIGVGAGLTNSYGIPIVMPMGFLKWNSSGRYEINVELANTVKASVARRFSDNFKLSLVLFDMDGMTAVVKRENDYKIYGATRARAYLKPELKLGNKSSVYLAVGSELMNMVRISDRSLKGFTNSFKSNTGKWEFDTSVYLMAGFKYGF